MTELRNFEYELLKKACKEDNFPVVQFLLKHFREKLENLNRKMYVSTCNPKISKIILEFGGELEVTDTVDCHRVYGVSTTFYKLSIGPVEHR